MAKFNFKLQNLLNIKEKLEKQKKNELGQAIEKLNRYKKQKSDVEDAKKDIFNDMKKEINIKISASMIKSSNDYVAFLKKVLIQLQKNINICEKEVDKKREELLKIVTERKMYEKLREKDLEEYTKTENQKEQKNLDEVALRKYK
ncbi:MAG: flagellar export protein FliJ [Clostridiales bacterium GWE2_32_10]|nr:MAG: flagellar export protein FliJ [Clostridiales bacterium GWE2_32_10]HBY20618.1 flagellar export protein FliJ [Clostridiales bacterium]